MSLECECVHYSNGRCKKKSDEVNTAWCFEGICDVREPSNADLIRAMSDEGLSDLLCLNTNCESCRWCSPQGCILDEWLKQTADRDRGYK